MSEPIAPRMWRLLVIQLEIFQQLQMLVLRVPSRQLSFFHHRHLRFPLRFCLSEQAPRLPNLPSGGVICLPPRHFKVLMHKITLSTRRSHNPDPMPRIQMMMVHCRYNNNVSQNLTLVEPQGHLGGYVTTCNFNQQIANPHAYAEASDG